MTRRTQILRLAMLVALVLCAAAWLYFTPASVRVANPSGEPSPAPVPASEPAPRAALTAPLPPLPPREAPVADVISILQARADAGDGVAACRLGIELMRCQVGSRKYGERQAGLERELARQGAAGNTVEAGKVEAEIAALRATKASCAGLPAGLEDRAQDYLRAAAVAGEPSSLFRYAAGAGFDATDGYAYLVTPAFDQWRREAEAMMQRALASGRPEAALLLAFAHSDDDGLFGGLVANDAFQAYAYRRLLDRVFGESLAAFPFPLPQPSVPAADAARADAMAADWHRELFGGRQFDLMEVMLAEAAPPWSDDYAASPGHDACPGTEGGGHD